MSAVTINPFFYLLVFSKTSDNNNISATLCLVRFIIENKTEITYYKYRNSWYKNIESMIAFYIH